MTRKVSSKFNVIKTVLIGVIAVSMAVSVFFDLREQKKMQADRQRDKLAFADLLALENPGTTLDKAKLEEYLRYFQSIVEQEPKRADAHAMMGYCYFYLNDKVNAIASYEKAVELNPKFFWFHYNLATIAMLQSQYDKALEEFQNALATNPTENLEILRNSKIFVYIIYKVKVINPSLGERLKEGYGLSAYYVAKCVEKLGGKRQADLFYQQMKANGIEMPKEDAVLRLKIF